MFSGLLSSRTLLFDLRVNPDNTMNMWLSEGNIKQISICWHYDELKLAIKYRLPMDGRLRSPIPIPYISMQIIEQCRYKIGTCGLLAYIHILFHI